MLVYLFFFKDFAWMLGLVTSCASLDLIILVVHGCDLVIWLTILSDGICALAFRFVMLYSTCNVAFVAYDLALTISHCFDGMMLA